MILVFLAPSLLALLALVCLLPGLIAWHVALAEAPQDTVPQDGWAMGLMAEIEAPPKVYVTPGWIRLAASNVALSRGEAPTLPDMGRTMRSPLHGGIIGYWTGPVTKASPWYDMVA